MFILVFILLDVTAVILEITVGELTCKIDTSHTFQGYNGATMVDLYDFGDYANDLPVTYSTNKDKLAWGKTINNESVNMLGVNPATANSPETKDGLKIMHVGTP